MGDYFIYKCWEKKSGTAVATFPLTFSRIYRAVATSNSTASDGLTNWMHVSAVSLTSINVKAYITGDASGTKTCCYDYFAIGKN